MMNTSRHISRLDSFIFSNKKPHDAFEVCVLVCFSSSQHARRFLIEGAAAWFLFMFSLDVLCDTQDNFLYTNRE